MQLIIDPGGGVRCVYGEIIDLAAIGRAVTSRGSHVEPDGDGGWTADLAPVDGPRLGPFLRRNDALQAEVKSLNVHWLMQGQPT